MHCCCSHIHTGHLLLTLISRWDEVLLEGRWVASRGLAQKKNPTLDRRGRNITEWIRVVIDWVSLQQARRHQSRPLLENFVLVGCIFWPSLVLLWWQCPRFDSMRNQTRVSLSGCWASVRSVSEVVDGSYRTSNRSQTPSLSSKLKQ